MEAGYIAKDGSGALFECDKVSEKSPDFSGNLMIDGNKVNIGGWKNEEPNGDKVLTLRFNSNVEGKYTPIGRGSMVECEKATDKHPDYTGACTINGIGYSIGAWNRVSKGGKSYVALKASPTKPTEVVAPAPEPAIFSENNG